MFFFWNFMTEFVIEKIDAKRLFSSPESAVHWKDWKYLLSLWEELSFNSKIRTKKYKIIPTPYQTYFNQLSCINLCFGPCLYASPQILDFEEGISNSCITCLYVKGVVKKWRRHQICSLEILISTFGSIAIFLEILFPPTYMGWPQAFPCFLPKAITS